jgi:hypothetical protein
LKVKGHALIQLVIPKNIGLDTKIMKITQLHAEILNFFYDFLFFLGGCHGNGQFSQNAQ